MGSKRHLEMLKNHREFSQREYENVTPEITRTHEQFGNTLIDAMQKNNFIKVDAKKVIGVCSGEQEARHLELLRKRLPKHFEDVPLIAHEFGNKEVGVLPKVSHNEAIQRLQRITGNEIPSVSSLKTRFRKPVVEIFCGGLVHGRKPLPGHALPV